MIINNINKFMENNEYFYTKFLNFSEIIKKEFFRKTIHIMSSFVPFFYYYFPQVVLILLLFLTFLYFVFEVLRNNGIRIPIISNITELASRSRDEGKIVLGPVTLAIGIFLALIFFDFRIAIISIFAVSFGDGVASLFGKIIGGVKIPLTFGKTLSGSLGCFITLVFVYYACGLEIYQSLLIALLASIIEVLPTGDFDNLLIPVFIGVISKYFIF